METINANSSVLSNYEVLSVLKEIRSQQKRFHSFGNVATITYETISYLQETPCNQQTPEKIKNFMKALEPFKLTKSEKLMLLNNPPTTALEIQLMVEESEDRLTEEQVEQLLQVVQECDLVAQQ